MHFSLALLATAALSSASVLPRANSGTFNVTNAVFHSSTYSKGGGSTQYSFSVKDSLGGGSTTCSKTFANNQELPTFNYTACADPLWSFALFKTGSTALKGQYSLQITRYQVIDGHRTNNETSCNTNDVVQAAPNQNPSNPGTDYTLDFGGRNFTQTWQYTSPTKYYCPATTTAAS